MITEPSSYQDPCRVAASDCESQFSDRHESRQYFIETVIPCSDSSITFSSTSKQPCIQIPALPSAITRSPLPTQNCSAHQNPVHPQPQPANKTAACVQPAACRVHTAPPQEKQGQQRHRRFKATHNTKFLMRATMTTPDAQHGHEDVQLHKTH